MFRTKGIFMVIFPLLIFTAILCRNSAIPAEPYIAFSLREAQHLLQLWKEPINELVSLAGITRIVGMVHDEESKDVILIGRAVNGQPEANIDDLVVALRVRLLYNEWPAVSIDPDSETVKTSLQRVTFGGGIDGTQFGADFLECDIVLKKYSLELISPVKSVPSYKSLCFVDIKEQIKSQGVSAVQVLELTSDYSNGLHGRGIRAEESYQTRFWFYPKEPTRIVAKEGVFCIKELPLCIKAELLNEKRNNEEQTIVLDNYHSKPGERFAIEFTEHFQEMTSAYPILRRLKILFDMVAIADGILNLENSPNFDYLLNQYMVSLVHTMKEYKLEKIFALIERSDGLQHAVQISGGIEFRTELKWLNAGDVTPLRDIVLKTRPNPQALSWILPLDDWRMPNSDGLYSDEDSIQTSQVRSEHELGEEKGCSIYTNTFILEPEGKVSSDAERKFYGFPPPPPPPPPTMIAPRTEYLKSLSGVDISPKPIGEKEELDQLNEKILESKPKEDSLYWNIKLPKKE